MSLEEINGQTADTQRPTLSAEADTATGTVKLVHSYGHAVGEFTPAGAIALGIEITTAAHCMLVDGHTATFAPAPSPAAAVPGEITARELWRTLPGRLLNLGVVPDQIRIYGRGVTLDLPNDDMAAVDAVISMLGLPAGVVARHPAPKICRWNEGQDNEFIQYGHFYADWDMVATALPGWNVRVYCSVYKSNPAFAVLTAEENEPEPLAPVEETTPVSELDSLKMPDFIPGQADQFPGTDSLPLPERYDITIVGRTATVDGPLLHVSVPSWSDPFKLDRDTVPSAVFDMPIGTTVTALLTQTGQYDDPSFSNWEWPVADAAAVADSAVKA